MHQTRGESLDPQLNKANKHWVIKINSVGDAIKLAKALKEHEPRVFSRSEIMKLFAKSLQEKRIPVDKVSEGLWKKLLEEGYLQVVAEQSERTEVPPSKTTS